ncbi:DUF4349 domain-containing protein [Paenibacillus sp.]|uniref:DUF4349 domain-containing protein n=1 Tax=Paenibacillus sp. TaxID=58172 RepID=UPI002D5D7D01|nr:DUF4349 domain-containing protein [Paenibacillus sp.]HZG88269.1 DUF4349 domain-containing protein [Paenibacillus sp.]
MKKSWKGSLKPLFTFLAAAAAIAGCSEADGWSGGSSEMAAADSAAVAPMAMETKASVETLPASESPAEAAAPEPQAGGAASAGGAGSGVGGAAAPVQGAARMLIYNANVTMEVQSYAEAYTAVQNLIHLSGGYIVRYSEQSVEAEKSGSFTIKVPAHDFSGFMDRLEQIPNTDLNRSMNAQDVTEEFVDLEARLKAKQLVESKYLQYMEQASRAEDLIRFTNELAVIQEDIERMKGRMRYLQQNVDYSTVELRIYEPRAGAAALNGDTGLGERMEAAIRNSLNALTTVAEGVLIVVAGAIPIVVAFVLLGGPIYWFIRRRKAKSEKNRPLIP